MCNLLRKGYASWKEPIYVQRDTETDKHWTNGWTEIGRKLIVSLDSSEEKVEVCETPVPSCWDCLTFILTKRTCGTV